MILIFALITYNFASSQNSISNTSQFYTDSIYSKHLSEYRKHNIYLPKGYEMKKEYPIVYATDGIKIKKDVENINKKILDSLISNKIIKSIIYVESFCNVKIADSVIARNGKQIYLDYRNYEYVEINSKTSNNPELADRFDNHMSYFSEEFIPSIEKKLNIKVKKTDRIFYGYSNGAGFGINLLNRHPDILGNFICFSTLGSNAKRLKWNTNTKYPKLYIEYGNEESYFFKEETENIIENYKLSKSFYQLNIFHGGHDYKKWNKEFGNTLIKILK